VKGAGAAGRGLDEDAPFVLRATDMAALALFVAERMSPGCPADERAGFEALLTIARETTGYTGTGSVKLPTWWSSLADLAALARSRAHGNPSATRIAVKAQMLLAMKLERRRAKAAGEPVAPALRLLVEEIRAEIARLAAERLWGAPVRAVVRHDVDELGEAWLLHLGDDEYAALIRPRGRASKRETGDYFAAERFIRENA
jgi:hypothetical protein